VQENNQPRQRSNPPRPRLIASPDVHRVSRPEEEDVDLVF